MNIVKIPKKTRGKFREIAIPNAEEKAECRRFLPSLNDKVKRLCSESVHGFVNGKSPVTNAMAHINYAYSLSFDLTDFFDNVKLEQVSKRLSKEEIQILMPNGRAYQGLPSSPAIANLAAIEMDKNIIKFIGTTSIVYTRYADDLTFSTNSYQDIKNLKSSIPQIVSKCGFRINIKKTRLQSSSYGNRTITGVNVNDTGILPTRSSRRKLRAAVHQNNSLSAKGLAEWCKLKMPQPKKEYSVNQHELNKLTDFWGIRRIKLQNLPDKESDTDLGNDCQITGDLIYIIGASNWTTNWTSCMSHPNGGSHRGINVWAYLQGTRIAMLQSDSTLVIQGFEKKRMRARCFVHKFRNDKEYYDRVYGESQEAIDFLKKRLENAGIEHISKCERGEKVVGNVLKELVSLPYFDNLAFSTAKSSIGKHLGKKVYIMKSR